MEDASVEQEFTLPFEDLYINIQQKLSAECKKCLPDNVSWSQMFILWKLYNKRKKISELAHDLSITPGAITSLSNKLITSGYAIRKRDDADRRVVYLMITEKGENVLLQYRAEVRKTIARFFSCLSEEDIAHLTRIFQTLKKHYS